MKNDERDTFSELTNSENIWDRVRAAERIGWLPYEIQEKLVNDTSEVVRKEAASHIKKLPENLQTKLVNDTSKAVRRSAAYSIGDLPENLQTLLIEDEDYNIRCEVARTLAQQIETLPPSLQNAIVSNASKEAAMDEASSPWAQNEIGFIDSINAAMVICEKINNIEPASQSILTSQCQNVYVRAKAIAYMPKEEQKQLFDKFVSDYGQKKAYRAMARYCKQLHPDIQTEIARNGNEYVQETMIKRLREALLADNNLEAKLELLNSLTPMDRLLVNLLCDPSPEIRQEALGTHFDKIDNLPPEIKENLANDEDMVVRALFIDLMAEKEHKINNENQNKNKGDDAFEECL